MMIPESRTDQGYGGLGRVSSNGVTPSTNAMEILSRFRPIAPKPSTPKPGESAGSAPSDPPSSSTLSFERTSGGKAVSSERSRVKRNRKRIGSEPLLPPTRRAKRGQTPSKPRAVPTTVGGIQKAVEQFAPDKSGLQPMLPASTTTTEYRQVKGGASNVSNDAELASTDYMVMGDASAPGGHVHIPGWARPDRRKFVNGFGAFKMPPASNEWAVPRGVSSQDAGATPANETPVVEEPAFMVRAAAASTSQPYFGREVNRVVKMKGDYDRGFESYPRCVPDEGRPSGAVLMRPVDFMSNNSLFPMYANNQWPIDQVSHARSNGDSEVISDGNSREPKLVTLSLLPDTPSQSDNSPVPIKPSNLKHLPCLELSLQSDTRDWQETKPESPEELHKLSLFSRSYEEDRTNGFCASGRDRSRGNGSSSSGKESRGTCVFQEPRERLSRGLGSSRDCEDGSGIVMDNAHMERQYSASSDPIMLSDGLSGEILWANQAYVKADAERNQRLKDAGAPYLDDLGIPTKHSSFEFLTPLGSRTQANLWGFLKKFMTSESEPSRGNSHPEGREDGQAKETRAPGKSASKSTSNEKFSDGSQNSHPKLITPQPVRPVESTLRLECVLGTDIYAPPITDNVERVKEELESKSIPAVITDLKHRVSWVNSAYKKMVGQPECSWPASTMGSNANKDAPQHSWLIGEVMLECDEQLAQLSACFSCRVNVRWSNGNGEASISVHSEVCRVENDKRAMFVWKLDPWATAARFQSGASRNSDSLHSPQSLSVCQQ